MAASGCLFCGIAAGSVPATLVRDEPRVLAFRDINPQAPTHVLVIPREHYADAAALASADGDLLAEVVRVAVSVASDEGLARGGYRLVTNTGPDAGQSVDHVHFHLLGGRHLSWPPG